MNEAKNYTIIYNCNGGSSIESQIVLENSAIQQPTAPTKEGYTFDGWYTDNTFTTKFDFNKGITKDTEIFAKWISKTDLEKSKVTNNPETGDNIVVFAIIAMIALVGIIFTIKLKNKKNEKNNY